MTRGRKTGRLREATAWFAYEDGAIWLRTDRDTDWYRNLRREPRCRIRVGTTEFAATTFTSLAFSLRKNSSARWSPSSA